MKRPTRLAILALLVLITPVTACSSQSRDAAEETAPATAPTVAITGASVVVQAEGGTPYVTMTLTTSASDRLISAKVDPALVAGAVILTEPSPAPTPGPEGQPAPLAPGDPVDSVKLGAGKPTEFGPGSNGMWLAEPKELTAGSLVTLTLTLDQAGEIQVQAPVQV